MKTVIEMAREAGFDVYVPIKAVDGSIKHLERFAELARADAIADEREACAKVCSEMYLEGDMHTGLAADLIRARGQA